MRDTLLLLTMFSASVCGMSQQTIASGPAAIEGCPIGFAAQVNARVIARSIDDEKKHGDAPLLELAFRHDGSPIVSASVAVHGWSASNRFLPVFQSSAGQTAQMFELVSGAAGLRESEVRPDKVLFVDWVEVTGLKYADGSVWDKSADVQCRVDVSKFRLVGAEVR